MRDAASGAGSPDRSVRSARQGSADLDHRPLQLPLRLLHAGRGHGLAAPQTELLTYEEIARVARVCVERFGFEAIRLTGGEPLVRAHITRLIALLAPLGVDIALTTNGVKLGEAAHDLVAAGLRRVNVSLDTLRPRPRSSR